MALPTPQAPSRPSSLEYSCDAVSARSGCGLAESADDIVDHFLDQDAVIALAHHADDRLGAGGADQGAAVAVEAFLAGIDRRFDVGVVERLAAAVAHVLEDLRQRIEAVA